MDRIDCIYDYFLLRTKAVSYPVRIITNHVPLYSSIQTLHFLRLGGSKFQKRADSEFYPSLFYPHWIRNSFCPQKKDKIDFIFYLFILTG